MLDEADPLDTHHFLELMSTLRSESKSTVPDVFRRSGPSRSPVPSLSMGSLANETVNVSPGGDPRVDDERVGGAPVCQVVAIRD